MNRPQPRPSRRAAPRKAFTLIEVLLALALGSVIVFTVGMAIDIHFRAVNSGRRQIEEAQLARALMARIAADLRAAVQYDPMQTDKLLGAVTDATADAAQSALDAAGAAGVDTGAVSQTDAASSNNSSSSATSVVPPSTPGLYGTADQLQVDISRLPQLDRLQAAAALSTQSVELASDMKTVAWYLSTTSSVTASNETPVAASVTTGPSYALVRSELDRAVAAWAGQNGSPMQDQSAKIAATEVTALEFRYFDGSAWVDTWDSSASGGLPMAVEVNMAIRRSPSGNAVSNNRLPGTTSSEDSGLYHMVVFLPGAHAPSTTTDSLDSAAGSGSSASGNSGAASGGNTGGNSGGTSGGNTGGNTGGSTGDRPAPPSSTDDDSTKKEP